MLACKYRLGSLHGFRYLATFKTASEDNAWMVENP
jgi:hypothetical protein